MYIDMAVRIARKLGEVTNHIDNLEREIHDLIVLINGIGLTSPDVFNLAKKQLEGKTDKVSSLIHNLAELKHKMETLPPMPEPKIPSKKIPEEVVREPEEPVIEEPVKPEIKPVPSPEIPPLIPAPIIKKQSIRITAPKVRSRNR